MSQNNELEYAGFWIRVGASLLDTLMLLIITLPITLMIYGDSFWENESMIMGPADFLINYIFPAIVVIAFWLYKSATPGKMILGLKVVDINSGKPLSTRQAIGRYLGYSVSAIPLLLGIFWIAWDRKKQGWHDKLANSAVIRDRNTVDKVKFDT
ncbi:MAG TPA: RDD family protein [Bacteroidetes bacterium]|nr:RDD family protein [Bacteroidota bacterium]